MLQFIVGNHGAPEDAAHQYMQLARVRCTATNYAFENSYDNTT